MTKIKFIINGVEKIAETKTVYSNIYELASFIEKNVRENFLLFDDLAINPLAIDSFEIVEEEKQEIKFVEEKQYPSPAPSTNNATSSFVPPKHNQPLGLNKKKNR